MSFDELKEKYKINCMMLNETERVGKVLKGNISEVKEQIANTNHLFGRNKIKQLRAYLEKLEKAIKANEEVSDMTNENNSKLLARAIYLLELENKSTK